MTKEITVSATADLHGYLPKIHAATIIVIAGDIFPGEMDKDLNAQGEWFRNTFLPWVDELECKRVVLVAGNHDHWIAANNEPLLREFAPSAWKKLVYLCDSGFEFKRLKIYGTPWMPTPFVNKAFSSSSEVFLREKYSQIPQQVDLLITHTVPYDCNYIGFSNRDMKDLGNKELRNAVETRDISVLVGGHIHDSSERVAHMDFGTRHTEMVNVACCDNDKQPLRLPIRFSIGVEYKPERLDRPFRIACLGDSITYGFGLDDNPADCYPAQLQKMLGDGFEVKSFGRNGACVRKDGGLPYMSTIEYLRAMDWDADAYVICLGTNDLVNKIDDDFLKVFKADYKELIRSLREKTDTLERAKDYEPFYVVQIPPVPQLFRGWDEEKTVGRINNTIYEIAREYRIKLIDFHSAFKTFNEEELFSDGIHPNRRGAELMAKILYPVIDLACRSVFIV